MIKKYLKYTFLACFWGLCSQFAKTQALETNPFSIKWNQVKTEHFRVIFPKGLDSVAKNTGLQLENHYLAVSTGLGVKPKPISIILQSNDNESNGFVSNIPRRSEFFNSVPQDYTLAGNNNFINLLSIHEYRHVAQYAKAATGFNKLAQVLFGNMGLTGLAHVSYPSWFWEGDATGTETALSDYGRGRIPNFTVLQRAQLFDNTKPYNYSTAVARSYKQALPNHYVLGYYLTNYMKEKYGANVWDKLLYKQNHTLPLPFGFSKQIKHFTGKSIDKLYGQIMAEAKAELHGTVENRKLYESIPTQSNKYFTSYLYPQPLENGEVLAIKSGLGHIAQIVRLSPDGTEKKIYELGNWNDSFSLSAAQRKVTWAELIPDVRWQRKNYSVVKVLDIDSRQIQVLGTKARFSAPALNSKADYVVAVETMEDASQKLVVINAVSGYRWKEIAARPGQSFLHPSWGKGDESILVIKLEKGKKSLVSYHLDSGKEQLIFEAGNQNIAVPKAVANYVLYNNAQNGIDEIFAYDNLSKKHFQLSYSRHGAYNAQPSIDGKMLYFNDFTKDGYKIVKVPFEVTEQLLTKLPDTQPAYVFAKWMENEPKKFDNKVDINSLEVKPYSKWNILNVFNWGPVFSPDASSASIGLQSQDLLSTTAISVDLGYDPQERQKNYQASISYEGFFPIIDLSFVQAGRQTLLPKGSLRNQPEDLKDRWQQRSVALGISLPFTFFNNAFRQKLLLSTSIAHTEGIGYDLPSRYFFTEVGNATLQTVNGLLSFSRLKKTAKRDLGPRWGQSLLLYFKNTPFGSGLHSYQQAAQVSFIFPGMARHDNLRLKANFIRNAFNNTYFFASPVAWARGYGSRLSHRLSTFSLDYQFKIADPDLSIGRLLHVQRLKANLFADHSQGYFVDNKNQKLNQNFNSIGLDLSSVFNFMRFQLPVDAGIRFAYLPQESKIRIMPLLLEIPL